MNEMNVVEVIYGNKRLAEFLCRTGVVSHLRKARVGKAELLCEYLRVDSQCYEKREYHRISICEVDSKALSGLNICDEKEHCVIKTFSCHTNQGWRLLRKFFGQPLRNQKEIEKRLNTVEAFMPIDLRDILSEFPDLVRLSKKISSGRITIQEILRLFQAVGGIPKLIDALSVDPFLDPEFILPLKSIHTSHQPLQREIEDMIDMEAIV